MHVLGISNAASHSAVDPSWVCAKTSTNSRYPRISCAKASSIQLILYDRPHPKGMQYISLNPIALALGDKGSLPEDVASSEDDSEETKQEKAIKENRRKLAEKLKQHSIVRRVASARDKALPKIVNQVNWSWELEQAMQQNVGRLGPRPKRGLSVSERVVESATTMRNYVLVQLWTLFSVYLFPIVQKAFILVLLFHRMVAEILLIVLEFRAKPGYAALKDISATAQQIEIRLQQFCYWPMQYVTLRQRKANWASVTTSHPDYIRFYNSLWLVANDVIIGMAVGSYIIEHKDWVADQIRDLLRTYTVEALQRGISWLMGWPAGLKLNGELAAFLGDLFLWVIDYWSSKLQFVSPAEVLQTDIASRHRLHRDSKPHAATHHLVHWVFVFCRGKHAYRNVFRLIIGPHHAHLLVLSRVCKDIPLAAHHFAVSLPSISREKTQRPPQSY